MVQKFARNDPDEEKFLAVWEGMIEQTDQDLQDYFDNVDKSPALGNALWEAGAVDVWGIIEKRFFVKIFDELIKAGYNAGTIDSYCRIIYALFGEETEIEIVIVSPLELTVNVNAEYTNIVKWVTKTGNRMKTKDGFFIGFRTLLVDIPRGQVRSIIKAISNAGTKGTFNFNIV